MDSFREDGHFFDQFPPGNSPRCTDDYRSIPAELVLRRMIWANPAMSRLIGYSPAEYRNRESRLLYVDDEEYHRVGEELLSQLSARGNAEVESVLKRKDGNLVPSLFHVVHLSGESPDRLSLIAITDISSSKVMQEALREKGEKYQTLFEELPVGIFRSTLSGRFLEVNRTLASLFGYQNPAEMIERIRDIPDQIYCDPEDRKRTIRKTAENGDMHCFEIEYRREGGGSFPVGVALTASSYLLTRIKRIRVGFDGNQLTQSELTSFLERIDESDNQQPYPCLRWA